MARILKYNEAKQKIIQLVHDWQLKRGDKLPSERELVGMLGLSSISVHRALDDLRDTGIIRKVHGVGSFLENNLKEVIDCTSQLGLINIGDHLYPDARGINDLNNAVKKYNATYKVFSVPHELDPTIFDELAACDRFIVTGFINKAWIEYLSSLSRPIVQVGESDYDASLCKVCFDWYQAVYQMIRKMKRENVRNIGFLLPEPRINTQSIAMRSNFFEAAEAAKINLRPELVQFVPHKYEVGFVKQYMARYGGELEAVLTVEPSTLFPLLIVGSAVGFPEKLRVGVFNEVYFMPNDAVAEWPRLYNVFFSEKILEKAVEILYAYPYTYIEERNVFKLQPSVEGAGKAVGQNYVVELQHL